MILPGLEIDIVVAGSASGLIRICVPCLRLGRAGVLLVAGLALQHAGKRAAAAVGGELDILKARDRVAEADDKIVAACHYARQVLAVVDLVGHYFHVQSVAAAGIRGLRLVAHDAQLDPLPRPTVEGELIVALVAG